MQMRILRSISFLGAPLTAVVFMVSACGGAGDAGTPGTDGITAQIAVSAEPAGAHCTYGGNKVSSGLDSNTNGLLDSAEITSTSYVCNGNVGAPGSNGQNGTNGTNGTNGANALLSMVSEPAGANCTYGGNKVSSGLDSNANGVLDPAEITSTSYVCDGVPAPPMSWIAVTAPTLQAQPNTGYIANNDEQPVVVTLPANPAVGDIVSVTGAGVGGWTIAQNSGQAVYTQRLGGAPGANWIAREPNVGWKAIASSADGRKLVALKTTGIYTSSDGGLSWVAHPSPNGMSQNWSAVASSADGTKLVAVERNGQIYTSADSGASWTVRESVRDWRSVASSADGDELVAVARGAQIYTSADSGVSWAPQDSVRNWQAVASSADGSMLAAVVSGGQIYTSTNNGATWTPRNANLTWQAIASSADGNKLVAVTALGQMYTSTDAGLSWTLRMSVAAWKSVASSADGSKLVAAENGGLLYTSTDGGASWTSGGAPNTIWQGVASSADGSRLVAATPFSALYTSIPSTTLGGNGSISGSNFDSIELQYVGGGMFNVLSHEGSLTIQ